MTYLGELRANWRPLVAAAIGLGSGLSIQIYAAAIFAPKLLQSFGWSKSQFALTGVVSLMVLLCLPVVGRLTDLFGTRRIAAVGVVAMPITYLMLAYQGGDIREYVVLALLQVIFGIATTPTVYSRVVAERFARARGLALSIVIGWPALVGAFGGPPLSRYIDTHGWQAGYQLIAVFSAVTGVIALIMLPPRKPGENREAKTRRRATQDYPLILRSPAFWVIIAGFLLCNFPHTLGGMQLKLLLLENGASSETAALLISVFAFGVAAGRFACGVALDRLPPHIVAAVSMAAPGLGLLLLASHFDAPVVLAASVLLMGLSLGAEGDIAGYLTARIFGLQIYSSVLGLVYTALAIASAAGAMLLSLALKLTEHYTLFVFLSAIGVLIGGALFMLLGRPSFGGAAMAPQSDRREPGRAPDDIEPAIP